YQTSWFATLAVAAAMTGLYLIYTLRLKQVAHRMRVQMQARVEERERNARELHDTLLQSGQGLILTFRALATGIPGEDLAHQKIERTLDLANQVMAEGRDRVRNLRDSNLSPKDLPTAFREVAESFENPQPGFKVVVDGNVRELKPRVLDETH